MSAADPRRDDAIRGAAARAWREVAARGMTEADVLGGGS